MRSNQRGQILLIIILLSTVLLTVALSVSQITTQETKISKLEEDSKRAFAAAEAGIEAQLKTDPNLTTDISVLLPGAGLTGQASTSIATETTFYQDIKKDEQLTVYLRNYNPVTEIFSDGNDMNLTFYFVVNGHNCTSTDVPALELTFISKDDASPQIGRKIIEPCNPPRVANDSGAPDTIAAAASGETFSSKTFQYKTPSAIGTTKNVNLLLIRPIFIGAAAGAKVGVLVSSDANMPAQGQLVTSIAQTTTGVAKKIQLFQSYPQIPADLFVTSF